MSQPPNGISIGSAIFAQLTLLSNTLGQTDGQTTLRATSECTLQAMRPNNRQQLTAGKELLKQQTIPSRQPGSLTMSSRHLKARIQMPLVAAVSSEMVQVGCSSWTYSGRKPNCTMRSLLASLTASLFSASTTSSAEKPEINDRCSLPFSESDKSLWINWNVPSSEFRDSLSSSLITNAWNNVRIEMV